MIPERRDRKSLGLHPLGEAELRSSAWRWCLASRGPQQPKGRLLKPEALIIVVSPTKYALVVLILIVASIVTMTNTVSTIAVIVIGVTYLDDCC